MNSTNKQSVSLEENPEPRMRSEPGKHLEFKPWDPQHGIQLTHVWIPDLQKLWHNKFVLFWATEVYGNLLAA